MLRRETQRGSERERGRITLGRMEAMIQDTIWQSISKPGVMQFAGYRLILDSVATDRYDTACHWEGAQWAW